MRFIAELDKCTGRGNRIVTDQRVSADLLWDDATMADVREQMPNSLLTRVKQLLSEPFGLESTTTYDRV